LAAYNFIWFLPKALDLYKYYGTKLTGSSVTSLYFWLLLQIFHRKVYLLNGVTKIIPSGPQGPVGDKGLTGDKGETGDQGSAATIDGKHFTFTLDGGAVSLTGTVSNVTRNSIELIESYKEYTQHNIDYYDIQDHHITSSSLIELL